MAKEVARHRLAFPLPLTPSMRNIKETTTHNELIWKEGTK